MKVKPGYQLQDVLEHLTSLEIEGRGSDLLSFEYHSYLPQPRVCSGR